MLIFSDMHFGIDKNSDDRINDAMKVLEWIASVGGQLNEKICIFAGDWFHDRDEIDVKTAIKAKEGLKFIKNHFDKFYFIAGNHDYYYNNSPEISSASLFDDMDGIEVIKDTTSVIECNGSKILLAPWFYNPAEEVGHYDVMIGHFEFVGGRMNGGFSKIGHNPSAMLSVAPLVFTGHYHLTSELERETGKIVTIGSPYQQNWGDCGDKKRIIRYDGNQWESIYNQVSPQYNKIDCKKLVNIDEDTLKKFFNNPIVKQGFIKIISDSNIDGIGKLIETGTSCGVRKIEADYSALNTSINESIENGMDNVSSKDIRTYVHDFVDNAIMNDPCFSAISAEKSHLIINQYFDQMQGAISK